MNLNKYGVDPMFRMSRKRLYEIKDVCPYIIRIAKALARDLGEDNPDAYYYYLGPAVMYRNDNRRDDTPEELERVTLEAETC